MKLKGGRWGEEHPSFEAEAVKEGKDLGERGKKAVFIRKVQKA